MPIYEYKCEECGKILEKWSQKFLSDSKIKCDQCGANAKQIISRSNFILKGGGWAKTGYQKTSTPVESENTSKVASRKAIIKDRNTDQFLGYGKEETVIDKK